MLYIAYSLAEENDINPEAITKLLRPYFNKIFNGKHPGKLQTGPAVRNDTNTMNKHIKLLEKHKDWQNVYRFVSESITKTYKKDNEENDEKL
jgi:hypothetical protein